ncbi:MAG TPA: hypothetical protein VKB52_05085 [Rhodanobacteraceae bacterium]|nr:hypothetical protein [Rhodanobacteraceae bacterium]
MLDETSRARLAEMGVDVYVPRVRGTVPAAAAVVEPARTRVALLARAGDAAAKALVADVGRALKFARVESAVEAKADARLHDAAGLVVFGDTLAREAGAALPVERQKAVPWVAAGEADALAGNAPAKRALWSELKRMARSLARG